MNKQPYHFEIKDVVTQFIAAFDDVVINRYNKQRQVQDRIEVRYLYAPKERVLHDIVNKAKHIQIPAISVSIGSVERVTDRVFNKITGSYGSPANIDDSVSKFLPSPVPIDIGINMSIITRYQTDMDQILSNFIPYSNPYVVISWKIPSDFTSRTEEIRSQVLWSGSVNVQYPQDLTASSPYRVTADTTFTIKGWLFSDNSHPDGSRIYYIDSNFTPVTGFDYI